jgi:hypothetical protein
MLTKFAEISGCDLHWLITGEIHESEQLAMLTHNLTLDQRELEKMRHEIAQLRREVDRINIKRAAAIPQHHEGIPAEMDEEIRQLTETMGAIMARMVARMAGSGEVVKSNDEG